MSFIEIIQEFPDKAADKEGYLLMEWDQEYRKALTHLIEMITPSTIINIPDIKAAYTDVFKGAKPTINEIKTIEEYCNENGGMAINELLTSCIRNLKADEKLPSIEKHLQDICEKCKEFEYCDPDCEEMTFIKEKLGVE